MLPDDTINLSSWDTGAYAASGGWGPNRDDLEDMKKLLRGATTPRRLVGKEVDKENSAAGFNHDMVGSVYRVLSYNLEEDFRHGMLSDDLDENYGHRLLRDVFEGNDDDMSNARYEFDYGDDLNLSYEFDDDEIRRLV